MKTKKLIIYILTVCTLYSCTIFRKSYRPKYFTNQYEQKYSGLDKLLDIDGCFTTDPNVVDGGIFFFRDGLVCNFKILPNGEFYYILWGTYVVEDGIIKTQRIRDANIDGLEVDRDLYEIINRKEIKRIGYMDYGNRYSTGWTYSLQYSPLPQPISTKTCWLLKKKWFWTKEAWERRNK